MLDALRYLVCWMPIILSVLFFFMKELGLDKLLQEEAEDEMADMEAARNATLQGLAANLTNMTVALTNASTSQNHTLTL